MRRLPPAARCGAGSAGARVQEEWDCVVLQEQSTLPLTKPDQFTAAATKLHGLNVQSNELGKTVLFMTWAKKDAPQSDCKQLADAYNQAKTSLGSSCVVAPVGGARTPAHSLVRPASRVAAPRDCPAKAITRAGRVTHCARNAGLAWQESRLSKRRCTLHAKDGSHPNPTGSYLAACVLFAGLPNRSPSSQCARGVHAVRIHILRSLPLPPLSGPERPRGVGTLWSPPPRLERRHEYPESSRACSHGCPHDATIRSSDGEVTGRAAAADCQPVLPLAAARGAEGGQGRQGGQGQAWCRRWQGRWGAR